MAFEDVRIEKDYWTTRAGDNKPVNLKGMTLRNVDKGMKSKANLADICKAIAELGYVVLNTIDKYSFSHK